MKRFKSYQIGIIGSLALLVVNVVAFGFTSVQAQPHDGAMSHDSMDTIGCQQQCNISTQPTHNQTQRDDQEEPDGKPGYSYPATINFTKLNDVQRLTDRLSEDFRLLRPPDKLALNCIFRI